MARLLRHDEAALATIYDRYHQLLYTVALRITGDRGLSEEVLQDVFHIVWRAAGAFQPTGNLAAQLVGIARHRAIDATRSRTFHARSREQLLDHMQQAIAPARIEEAERQIVPLSVRAALAELPPQLQALDLAYYGGLTQVEIAARLDVPLGTVKSWLRCAIEHLRDHMWHLEP
jgi:RNA polymerase sigma-70 factor (ECF subfamily)